MVAIVLLPGLDGTGNLLDKFVAALGRDAEVTVVSYPVDKPLGYADLEQLVGASLPAGQPFFLMGESFSGPVAISVAATMPAGLRGVILCCSFVRSPLPKIGALRQLVHIFPVTSLPATLLSFFLLGRFSTDRLRSALADTLAAVSPSVLRGRALAALSVDASRELARVAVPILYLRASEDRVIPKRASELIRTLAPSTRIVDFVAPHFLLQVLPDAAASAVKEFLSA